MKHAKREPVVLKTDEGLWIITNGPDIRQLFPQALLANELLYGNLVSDLEWSRYQRRDEASQKLLD